MKVCVVGAGGREHALALALARTAEVVVAPGNPGMPGTGAGGYPISVTDVPPESVPADLWVIGPEQPLVDGLADKLRADDHLVFGPGADGARLEGSKAFMKEVLDEARVPTARWGAFDEVRPAHEFVRQLPGPWVVKTDGLASGKGVLVTDDRAEAEADIVAKLSGDAFGDAGRRVVVEEGLVGAECSLLVLCDGTRIVALPVAQDYKRLEDGDGGPNTGGMGACSAVGLVADAVVDRILDVSVEPLVAALRRRGIDYRGVLYAGLILTTDGPKVLEYNVRFGDPETQVVLPRVDEDVTGLLAEAAAGHLRTDPRPTPSAAVCVVLAAAGYPVAPRTGDRIEGLERAAVMKDVAVLHAGTGLDDLGRPVTAGGRVLGVTGTGPVVAGAREKAYGAVDVINWEGMQHRRDIAAGMGAGAAPS
ncbi:MAG TPA: phosphoribosylamine--glycine ligase [Acidimicrobiales bacterium]|nr:phosphoribosylamine--glycine ligase [Acidimicrobiales bacterium]